MNYVMYIQNAGNLGHAEFDDHNKAYDAMKLLVARHIGVAANMLDGMMNASGDGPFFYLHRDDAYVDSNGGAGSLSIRIEAVEEPILAYAELNIEKTYICLTLMDQFYTVLDACHEKIGDLEMEPTEVLTLIGKLTGIYECLKAVDIELDEETEKEYQKLCNTLNFYLGKAE